MPLWAALLVGLAPIGHLFVHGAGRLPNVDAYALMTAGMGAAALALLRVANGDGICRPARRITVPEAARWPRDARKRIIARVQRLVRICVLAVIAVGMLSAIAAIALIFGGPAGWLDFVLAATAVIFLPTALVGAAVLRAGSDNAAGWILLVAGVALPLSVACQVVADAAFASGARGVPGPEAFALVSAVAGVFGVPLIGTLGVLLFPDGSLSGGARRLAWWCVADLAALLVWALFSPTLLGTRAEKSRARSA